MAHGDGREGEVKGKLANGVGRQYSSHYLGTWCNAALLPLMRIPRLPVVDWTDAPRRFKWTRPFRRKTKSGFCAWAIKCGLLNNHEAVVKGARFKVSLVESQKTKYGNSPSIKSEQHYVTEHNTSVGIATRYGPGIESRWERDFPHLPWGPHSILYNGYRIIPGGVDWQTGIAVTGRPPRRT